MQVRPAGREDRPDRGRRWVAPEGGWPARPGGRSAGRGGSVAAGGWGPAPGPVRGRGRVVGGPEAWPAGGFRATGRNRRTRTTVRRWLVGHAGGLTYEGPPALQD